MLLEQATKAILQILSYYSPFCLFFKYHKTTIHTKSIRIHISNNKLCPNNIRNTNDNPNAGHSEYGEICLIIFILSSFLFLKIFYNILNT